MKLYLIVYCQNEIFYDRKWKNMTTTKVSCLFDLQNERNKPTVNEADVLIQTTDASVGHHPHSIPDKRIVG